MDVHSVSDAAFGKYGRVVEELDFAPLLDTLAKVSEKPAEGTIYVAGDSSLEALPLARRIQDSLYGGMPVQIGYCNGTNRALNCLEYHRGSEVNVAADDIVLQLAPLQSVREGTLDTALVEGFFVPRGKAVLLYETTLHYAPCDGKAGEGFRVAVILPKGTNTQKPGAGPESLEDKLLWARNKWLLAHPDSPEAAKGAHVGLVGENITL